MILCARSTTLFFGILSMILIAGEASSLDDPSLKWTVELGPAYAGTPAAYPSENPNSLIYSTGGAVARVGEGGEVIFRVELGPERGRGGMYWPSIGDVDGDGKEEIVAGRNDGIIYALDAENGEIIWECTLPERLTGYEWADAADLDGDGRAEVVVTTMYGWVYAIDDNGTILWGSKMEAYRPSAPTIADIDSDGEPEIVYGTSTRYMIALDASGNLEWASFQPPHHLGRTVPLVADTDKDGRAEVYGLSSMLSPGKGLVSLNGRDGSLRWYGLTIGKAYSGRALTRFADGTTGILSCDKGGNIHAQHPDGSLRWHTRLSGRGAYNPPITADIDGDGALEIVAAVRDTSTDGKGNNWYVLNADDGEILGAWNHPNQGYMGPAVLDLDGDGSLEVVICSKEGNIAAYDFGGTDNTESVVFGHASLRTFPVRVANPEATEKADPPSIQLTKGIGEIRYGANRLNLTLPSNSNENAVVELALTDPSGYRSLQVFKSDQRSIDASWRALTSGDYHLSLRLVDLESGDTLGVQELEASLEGGGSLSQLTENTLAKIGSGIDRPSEEGLSLTLLSSRIEARLATLLNRIDGADDVTLVERNLIADEADDFAESLSQSADFAALTHSEIESGNNPKFVCWHDSNPWNDESPHKDLPSKGGPPSLDVWAFGNEKESVCFNILNLSVDPITLRVEPGTVSGPEPLPKVHEVTTLHRVLWLPTVDGDSIADMLPRLDEGYLLDIAPGEIRQLWINLSTRDLPAGQYEFVWPLRSLDLDAVEIPITVNLDVSKVRLPDESRFYTGYWSRNNFEGFSSIPDLNDHLQNLWDRAPAMPAAKANSEGELVGELDWSAWDEFLDQIQQYGIIRLHHIPVPTFPEGVEVTEELRLKAQRNYVQAWNKHMKKYDLDYKNFAFYVEDETGLTGTHENFMEKAKHLKEIDPNLQVYANPWGAITKEMLRDMAPLTDVWQPGMEVIEYHGPEVVEIMRADGGRRIAMYTPPGGARTLLPLGFFRSQPWLALEWGIEGGGWWVYHQANLFGTGAYGDPSYGGINWDGRDLAWSRRWEAMRDGVEDFNAVVLLRDLAEEKGDEKARSVIDDAVGYVASECITGMAREAADYDMEFSILMKHRSEIRTALERLRE